MTTKKRVRRLKLIKSGLITTANKPMSHIRLYKHTLKKIKGSIIKVKKRKPMQHFKKVRFGKNGRYRKRTLINEGIKYNRNFSSDFKVTQIDDFLKTIDKNIDRQTTINNIEEHDKKLNQVKEQIYDAQLKTMDAQQKKELLKNINTIKYLKGKEANELNEAYIEKLQGDLNDLIDVANKAAWKSNETKQKMTNDLAKIDVALSKEQLKNNKIAAEMELTEKQAIEATTKLAMIKQRRELNKRKQEADNILKNIKSKSDFEDWGEFDDDWTSDDELNKSEEVFDKIVDDIDNL